MQVKQKSAFFDIAYAVLCGEDTTMTQLFVLMLFVSTIARILPNFVHTPFVIFTLSYSYAFRRY
jgi:hypothetical protein